MLSLLVWPKVITLSGFYCTVLSGFDHFIVDFISYIFGQGRIEGRARRGPWSETQNKKNAKFSSILVFLGVFNGLNKCPFCDIANKP